MVGRVGEPGLEVFIRSAAKPFQVIPFLQAGGFQEFDLEPADLALMCASHSGTANHVRRAKRLLEMGGFGVEDLLCGVHPPFDREARHELRVSGNRPTPLHNNCSGKHAGKLLACRLLDLPTDTYVAPEHPLQRRILTEVAAFCGVAEERVGSGTDGCGVPAFRLPLASAAKAYASLADPELAGVNGKKGRLIHKVVDAMTSVPSMVAGPGRFTTRLMEVTGGRLLGKEGAQGFYSVAIRGPVALGLALKIADGTEQCRDGVVLDILCQLGSLSAEELTSLSEFYVAPVTNHSGAVVGEIVPDVELEAIA